MIAGAPCAFYDPLKRMGDLPVAREQRKLAAILAADVVGYSRLMSATRVARWRVFMSIERTGAGTHGGRRRRSVSRAA
jgi:class 3 adenylate cyclase